MNSLKDILRIDNDDSQFTDTIMIKNFCEFGNFSNR